MRPQRRLYEVYICYSLNSKFLATVNCLFSSNKSLKDNIQCRRLYL